MTWTQAGIALFTIAILCEQAHIASPIVLAWSHPGLRQIALSRPVESILLPVVAIISAIAVPFNLIWWVWWVWNAYHFGAQHYGVARIMKWRVDREFVVAATIVLMLWAPFVIALPQWFPWLMLAVISFNHWLVDIGLSTRVSRRWWLFLTTVLVLGCVAFVWKVPRADHIATRVIPWILQIIQAQWGVGIVHFMYSRWIWKFSDPQIRATIGPAIAISGLKGA